MKRKILEVNNLTKTYGQRLAVDDVSFEIFEGEILGFLGANGAGKSTTMKMITGMSKIDSGDVLINGKSISNHFESAIKDVGALIETPQFFPYLSGYQNLKYFASLYDNVSSSKIKEILHLVGLGSRMNEKVKNYSLGMKQRLGIAQSLLNDPKLLVLDEPTNGLDANGIRETKRLLRRIADEKGTAILISSHIMSIMEKLCDKICIINNGKIMSTKTFSEIQRDYAPNGSYFIKTSAPNFAGKIIQDEFNRKVGIIDDCVFFNTEEKDMSTIISALTSKRIPIFSAGQVQSSLEDIFPDIVGSDNDIN